MQDSTLLPDLITRTAEDAPRTLALTSGPDSLTYEALATAVDSFASGAMSMGLKRGERVAVYLEKRFETVIASFGALSYRLLSYCMASGKARHNLSYKTSRYACQSAPAYFKKRLFFQLPQDEIQ